MTWTPQCRARSIISAQASSHADGDNGVGTTLVLDPYYVANFAGPVTLALETTRSVAANPGFVGTPGNGTAVNPEFILPGKVFDNELLDAHYIAGDGRVNEKSA